ncbi:MAG TPA: TIR domain-containing protein [Thermoanaerobaculia bacterium]|jgi:hypothetical protein|nr:TIR domain-containing protein [Thermoanaerobaculia bacterium]
MMKESYDLFISYSHDDKEWVRTWLLPRLEAASIAVCIDWRDFAIGISSIQNMEDAVERSGRTILVLSPSWVKSEWASFESILSQSSDPVGVRQRTLPLLLQPCELPRRLKILTYADFSDSANWDVELGRLVSTIHGDVSSQRLSERLDETVRLYLTTCLERDQYARLDQAGEYDPDRTTPLRHVFIDLEVRFRDIGPGMSISQEGKHIYRINRFEKFRDRNFSVLSWFLREANGKTMVIGGPGQGKSTLGQYLAQIHRAALLDRVGEFIGGVGDSKDLTPTKKRLPFRVILKYFAQWLSDKAGYGTLEAYLAEQLSHDSAKDVAGSDIHEILRGRPCLLILDGLDEVVESVLRQETLDKLKEFQSRVDAMRGIDLQIMSTSRPTGYLNDFDPIEYVHLELQALSREKVDEYARRWARVKVSIAEERQRIIETLHECQEEEHTRLILSTPLQVAIILLVIKDGGRPPAQREALFQEYWNTIFRRERAKGRGILRTEEGLLFGLHAFLGYLLHRRAGKGNTRSLLSESQFRETVERFLRSQDRQSRDDVISVKARQMVDDARERLVLLVEPEPGYFGFELRSLQEFFAAVFLAQTASDTAQRFRRLKEIARHEHWSNVALFFSGRVVRNFQGEAANILELVCRAVDRETPDLYLRRGAWLALEIAVDGTFAANRDLQYGALEYALTILDVPLSPGRMRHLRDNLKKVTREDRRDIVRPILVRKLSGFPFSLLPQVVTVWMSLYSAKKPVLPCMRALLSSGDSDLIAEALTLGVDLRIDPVILAGMVRENWEIWLSRGANNLWHTWQGSAPYCASFIRSLKLSSVELEGLVKKLRVLPWLMRNNHYAKVAFAEINPFEPGEQLIELLRAWSLLSSLAKSRRFAGRQLISMVQVGSPDAELKVAADRFPLYPSLLWEWSLNKEVNPWARASLSFVIAGIAGPSERVTSMIASCKGEWLELNFSGLEEFVLWRWPLLRIVVRYILRGERLPEELMAVSLEAEIESARNVASELAKFQRSSPLSVRKLFAFSRMLQSSALIPESLAALAQRYGVEPGEFWASYVEVPGAGSFNQGESIKALGILSSYILETIDKDGASGLREAISNAFFWFFEWSREAVGEVLSLVDELLRQASVDSFVVALSVLCRVPGAERNLMDRYQVIAVGLYEHRDSLGAVVAWVLGGNIPSKAVVLLSELCSELSKIRGQKARYTFAYMISLLLSSLLRTHGGPEVLRQVRLKGTELSVEEVLKICDGGALGAGGICLLGLTEFPVVNADIRLNIFDKLVNAGSGEKSAWIRLLRVLPVEQEDVAGFGHFIELILEDTRGVDSDIRGVALDRYERVVKEGELGELHMEVIEELDSLVREK